MKEQIVEIPEKAGFYADNGGYCYISHADGTYEAEAVGQAEYVDFVPYLLIVRFSIPATP